MTYVVGIDLGTTNCAVAYAALPGDGPGGDDGEPGAADPTIEVLDIPQLVGAGEVAGRPTLPSFLLMPTEHQVARAAMALPWGEPDHAVGMMARDRGAELPGRLVSSAKSWLSHPGVDRTAPILPFRAKGEDDDSDLARISPVTASSRYLAHLAAAFEHTTGARLADQEVLITVPASFDAVARELTAVAAREAGLDNITLLEEPQAAFYAWLDRAGDAWRDQLVPGDVALVCDIGGGTSDFSLIEVTDDGAGNLALERVAVGDHILLGGDNMDLTLAHVLRQRLAENAKTKKAAQKLKPKQMRGLIHACRRGKESLLGDEPPASVPITILGGGSKLIGGTLKTALERADVESLILDGFFPEVDAGARPQERKAIGLREIGLPYATDPAVTRHLAAFLGRHEQRPTAILYNGGVMQAPALRRRVADALSGWYGGPLKSLGHEALDLAVARGAAYYGLVRSGRGIRIRGGTARAYYIGVEEAMPAIPGFEPPVRALCVAPAGMEEGTSVTLPDHELGFVVGEPSTFRFFASSVSRDDEAGDLRDVDDTDELVELPAVEAHLEAHGDDAGRLIGVTLSANVTEVGTLELWGEAKSGEGRWKLEYSVRGDDNPAADDGDDDDEDAGD